MVDQKTPVQNQTVKWNTQDCPTHYANLLQTSFTPFDISILFGQVESATENEVKGSARGRITTTPEQAFALIQLLQIALDEYKAKFGELRDVVRLKHASHE